MILASVKTISKAFGVRPLFEGVTFAIESKERIGLIGPNGAGKSTLLKVLNGTTTVDTGEVSFQKGLSVGFLEQTPQLPREKTVEEAILSVQSSLAEDERQAKGAEFIAKLGLSDYATTEVARLSGGWQKRVALARELMKQPQLLLLDEPTNHLDVESIIWLEEFLARSEFATLTVTHDRLFLQRVANRILELDRRNPQGLLSVNGDYATYLERKEALLVAQAQMETRLQNKLRRETEWLRRGAKARTTKQQARIQAADALKSEVEELEFRNQTRTARIDFQSSDKKPKRLIEAKQISKSYGDRVLFKNQDIFIGPGDRIGLLGTNGCGKSTLIRTLLGQEPPDSGSIFRSEHLKVAYFEQNRETLDPQQTLRKAVCPHGDKVIYRGTPQHIHGYLDRFLFRREQVDMMVGKLSGGEQARVLLARLMLHDANVLVLDEPTNDLDVETLDVLSDCLTQFDGAVLLVTHDRYFLDEVASQIIAFSSQPGVLNSFAGLHQWETWTRNHLLNTKPNKQAVVTEAPKKKTKLGFKEQREFSQIEDKILEAEAKLSDLKTESVRPEIQSNASKLSEIFQAIALAEQEVEKLYARWTELDKLNAGIS